MVQSRDANPRFERIEWANINWAELDSAPNRVPFQTRPWLEFLAKTKGAEPVVAELRDGSERFGFFTGLLVQRFRLRVLGSPMPGWTTPYMGFNIDPNLDRRVAVKALVDFALNDLRCVHLELRDRGLSTADVRGLGFTRRADVGFDERTFEIDLSVDEETLLSQMSSDCRRCLRKSEREGIVIEEADDAEFADEFHAQLCDVLSHKGLMPTYGVEHVRSLIRMVHPTGMLLLLRARDQTGNCVATGIFPGAHDTAYFWGGASRRALRESRPNEALQWYAMCYWKRRGMLKYDLGGFLEYKRRYGGKEIAIPGFRRSKYPVIAAARTAVPMGVRARQLIVGYVRKSQYLPDTTASHAAS